MTLKVKRSEIAGMDFEIAVAAHAADLKSHAAHMALVATGEAQAYPPPDAPLLVAAAILRPDLVPDYEIIEDGPTEAELFRQRQIELMNEVTRLEQEALHRVSPAGKRRLINIQLGEIGRRESAIPNFKASMRAPADGDFIATQDEIRTKMDEIALHGATLHAEIEDIDRASIDGWKPHSFPY